MGKFQFEIWKEDSKYKMELDECKNNSATKLLKISKWIWPWYELTIKNVYFAKLSYLWIIYCSFTPHWNWQFYRISKIKCTTVHTYRFQALTWVSNIGSDERKVVKYLDDMFQFKRYFPV